MRNGLTSLAVAVLIGSVPASLYAQTGAAAAGQGTGAKPAPAAKPLQLHSLDPTTQPDPFPPADLKNFTADSPTAATVEAYLHAVLGWDANRIWRVEAIQTTNTPGVSRVITELAERGSATTKPQSAIFYILPDGKHYIADSSGPQPFGAHPYADNREVLQARADGPSHGAAGKELELVEFADLQCPHCKEAQSTMTRLAQDFPKARIVFQQFPLTSIHPAALEAAAYGVCIARENSDAFFTYAQAVYDTQADLVADKIQDTLNAAVTKAGKDPAKVAACAATPAAKTAVEDSTKLGIQVGVGQTPMLAVNGRLLPLSGLPYETLKQIVVFQAQLDGVGNLVNAPSLLPSAGAVKP
jgi:protein-disulfide isomerase